MSTRRHLVTVRLLLGLSILTFGVALLLENLDLLGAEDVLRFWFPGLVIAVGFMAWRVRRLVGALLMILGCSLALDELRWLPWTTEDVWPPVLILLGAGVTWRALRGSRRKSTVETDSSFSTVAVWSGLERQVSSPSFESGELLVLMAGATVDLRQSFIAEGEAEISVFAMWGAAEILVPEDWAVTSVGLPLMGGFVDETKPPRGGSKQRLIVRGAALMGAVEIRNHEESDD